MGTRSLVVALLLTGAPAGCGPADNPEKKDAGKLPPMLLVDEREGTVERVGLGDSATRIERIFGGAPPYDIYQSITPLDVEADEITGPVTGGCLGKGRENALRYRGVSFFLLGDKTCDVTVTSARAETRRGLRPGDPIGRAEELYPELACGETDVGSDREILEPACTGQVGKSAYLWIGGDPINNFGMTTDPLRLSP